MHPGSRDQDSGEAAVSSEGPKASKDKQKPQTAAITTLRSFLAQKHEGEILSTRWQSFAGPSRGTTQPTPFPLTHLFVLANVEQTDYTCIYTACCSHLDGLLGNKQEDGFVLKTPTARGAESSSTGPRRRTWSGTNCLLCSLWTAEPCSKE